MTNDGNNPTVEPEHIIEVEDLSGQDPTAPDQYEVSFGLPGGVADLKLIKLIQAVVRANHGVAIWFSGLNEADPLGMKMELVPVSGGSLSLSHLVTWIQQQRPGADSVLWHEDPDAEEVEVIWVEPGDELGFTDYFSCKIAEDMIPVIIRIICARFGWERTATVVTGLDPESKERTESADWVMRVFVPIALHRYGLSLD